LKLLAFDAFSAVVPAFVSVFVFRFSIGFWLGAEHGEFRHSSKHCLFQIKYSAYFHKTNP
jgi:hypothetical protein